MVESFFFIKVQNYPKLELWQKITCIQYLSESLYIYFFFFFFFHHTTCESTCDTLASSAANQGDNTVSVAQGSTATPGATEQLLPPDSKSIQYLSVSLYIYNNFKNHIHNSKTMHTHIYIYVSSSSAASSS